MKKTLSVLLIVLLVVGSAFAGGAKEAGQSGTTTLRFSWWGGDERHTPTLKALDAYMAKNPNVKVEGEYGGWDGYYQKLVTQLAGGTAADLIQIDQPWLAELSSKGDIFAEITPSVIDLSIFDEAFLNDYCTHDGKLLGLPSGTNVNTMLVDTEMLKRFGIDPDTVWTWENIVTEGRKINQQDKTAFFNGASPDMMRMWFEVYMAQIAGGVVGHDGKIMFTQAQATQAFTYFKQWFDEGIVAPFSQTSLFYQKYFENPSWVNGKMATAWTWVSSMEKEIGNRPIETRPLPVMAGAKNSGVLMRPSQIIVVNNNSKNRAKALELLDYLFTDKEAIEKLELSRGIPATTLGLSVLASKGKITALTENATNEGVAQAGLPQSVYQMNSEVVQVLEDIIDEFGFGRLTPSEASAKLITNLNAVLATL